MSYIFKKTNEEDGVEVSISIQGDGHNITTLLEEFESFLRGCGFIFDGNIDIIEDVTEYYTANELEAEAELSELYADYENSVKAEDAYVESRFFKDDDAGLASTDDEVRFQSISDAIAKAQREE